LALFNQFYNNHTKWPLFPLCFKFRTFDTPFSFCVESKLLQKIGNKHIILLIVFQSSTPYLWKGEKTFPNHFSFHMWDYFTCFIGKFKHFTLKWPQFNSLSYEKGINKNLNLFSSSGWLDLKNDTCSTKSPCSNFQTFFLLFQCFRIITQNQLHC
jgi:hypothetical protein